MCNATDELFEVYLQGAFGKSKIQLEFERMLITRIFLLEKQVKELTENKITVQFK